MRERVTFGVFEFDPPSGALWRNGRFVRLQPTAGQDVGRTDRTPWGDRLRERGDMRQDGRLYRVKDSVRSADWERGFASLLPRFASDRFVAETVPCITFATLLRRHRVSRIDLLQIDAEGYDFEILKLVDSRAIDPR